jgi:hypothetical protein
MTKENALKHIHDTISALKTSYDNGLTYEGLDLKSAKKM